MAHSSDHQEDSYIKLASSSCRKLMSPIPILLSSDATLSRHAVASLARGYEQECLQMHLQLVVLAG